MAFFRGQLVDAVYIAEFLRSFGGDIRGDVLEMGGRSLHAGFGEARMTTSHVLDVDTKNSAATVIVDLSEPESLGNSRFQCFLLTQTLQYAPDMGVALRNAWRTLAPGGRLPVSVPTLSRLDPTRKRRHVANHSSWTRTPACHHVHGRGRRSKGYGSLLTEVAFLMALAAEGLKESELSAIDPCLPVVVRTSEEGSRLMGWTRGRTIILAYHRVAQMETDPHQLCVRPDWFADQVHYLSQHAEIIPLSAVRDRSSERRAAITFDDGYADNASVAMPILEGMGAPASFFVTSGMIATQRQFWWDRLESILSSDHLRSRSS